MKLLELIEQVSHKRQPLRALVQMCFGFFDIWGAARQAKGELGRVYLLMLLVTCRESLEVELGDESFLRERQLAGGGKMGIPIYKIDHDGCPFVAGAKPEEEVLGAGGLSQMSCVEACDHCRVHPEFHNIWGDEVRSALCNSVF
jgi:hypothetical protein